MEVVDDWRERKQMPNLATSQAVVSDFSEMFSGFACHPRQAALLLQLLIPAWIAGNLGPLYEFFHELIKRVRKVILLR